MASSKEFLHYILSQLANLPEISHRAMMGEFIIYYQGKIVGGIYDNNLLVKNTQAARDFLQNTPFELVAPYKNAKEMILIEFVDDVQKLEDLFNAMLPTLPIQKARKYNCDLCSNF